MHAIMRVMLLRLVLPALALLPCACTDRATGDEGGSDDTASASGSSSAAPTTVDPTAPTTVDPTVAPTSTDATTTPVTTDPSGSTGEVSTTGAVCEGYEVPFLIPIVSLNVMLVIDQSPAMLDPWDHDADPATPAVARWTSLRSALTTALGDEDSLNLGLAPYPTPDAEDVAGPAACTVTEGLLVPTSEAPTAEVLAGLAPADPPPGSFVGGAPLGRALTLAAQHVNGSFDQPRALVVLANSAPNCSPVAEGAALLESLDVGAPQTAKAALDVGLPVFVFGIGAATEPSPAVVDGRPDGVIVSDALKDMAIAGGGNYINAADEAGLVNALSATFGHRESLSCFFPIDPAPGPDQAVTAVTIAGKMFPQVEVCEIEDGWRVIDDSIELCGITCGLFADTGDMVVTVSCV